MVIALNPTSMHVSCWRAGITKFLHGLVAVYVYPIVGGVRVLITLYFQISSLVALQKIINKYSPTTFINLCIVVASSTYTNKPPKKPHKDQLVQVQQ